MIERGDAELRAWLQSVIGDAKLVFDAPPLGSSDPGPTLDAYLFDVERPAAVASVRTPPLELRLGYLLSAWGSDVAAVHALLGRVVAGGLAQAQYELEFGESVALAWARLAGPARPGMIVRVRVTQDRGLPPAPPVREFPRIEPVSLVTLRGRITARDGTPISGAAVAIESLNRTASSDPNGAFSFAGIPPNIDLTLRVRAKGQDVAISRAATATDEQLHIALPL